MPTMTTEELLIFRIQNEIRALKLQTKSLEETQIRERLVKLKKTNPFMAEDLENQFLAVLNRQDDDKFLTAKKPIRRK